MRPRTDWWSDFFTGLTVDLWRAAVSEEQTRTESDFLEQNLRVKPPAAILDVPCGSGRLSLELAARGFILTGIDISKDFLDEARTNASSRNLRITYEQREMRDLPANARFDAAFCFGNSFGFLDDDGNAEFLKAVAHVLKPGARFVLDASSIAENVLPQIKERTEMQFGEILFKEVNHYDHEKGRLDTEYTFVKGERIEQRAGSHRLYTYREICELLKSAGFEISAAFGSLKAEPFSFGSAALYVVATTKG